MSVYYTNVARKGNKILARIMDHDGKRKNVEHKFKPELYLTGAGSSRKPDAMGMHKEPLFTKSFDNMYEMDKWLDENRDVPGMKIFGQDNLPYQFIAHKFRKNIKHNAEHIRVCNYDIEVLSGYRKGGEIINGPFPEPVIEDDTFKTVEEARTYHQRAIEFYKWWGETFPKTKIDPLIDLNAAFPIPLIQAQNMQTGQMMVFAMPEPEMRGKFNYEDYKDDEHIGGEDVVVKEFESEQELLAAFIGWWNQIGFDAQTGWNIEGFDVPYITERARKILGPDWVNALSPWGIVKRRNLKTAWGQGTTFEWVGCELLDMLELYKKHTYTTREKYSLDHISYCELGEKKIEYKEARSLNNLYFMDWCKYVQYGIKDPLLVKRINDKIKLLELTFVLSYMFKCNYRDTLGTVSPWNAKLYNVLLDKGMRPQILKLKDDAGSYDGGYVKEVVPGFYRWVVSVDLNSLYPHIMQQYNIGPETIVTGEARHEIIFEFVEELEALMRKETNPKRKRAFSGMIKAITSDMDDGASDCVDEMIIIGRQEFKTLKKHNVSFTPNVQFFRNDEMSILSSVTRDIYAGRKGEKKLMLQAEQRKTWVKEEGKRRDFDVTKYHHGKSHLGDLEKDEYRAKLASLTEAQLAEEYVYQEDVEAMQDCMQMGFKIAMNSMYGALANRFLRDYFDVRIASAITAAGRMINKWNIHYVNEKLNTDLGTGNFDYAFYGDTDSNYITLEKVVENAEKAGDIEQGNIDQAVNYLDNYYKTKLDEPIKQFAQDMCDTVNGYEQRMFWEREVIAQTAVWQAPKLYIMAVNNSEGVAYEKPKIKTMGVAARKSNYPEWCRDKMKDCYKTVLLGTQEQLVEQVKGIKREYMGLPIEKIAAASSVSNVTKYTGPTGKAIKDTPYNSKASIVYNYELDKRGIDYIPRIKDGDKMLMVNMKKGCPTGYHFLAFHDYLPEELGLEEWVDYEATYSKTFMEPIDLILAPRGWEVAKTTRLFGDRKSTSAHKQGKKIVREAKKATGKAKRLF